MSARGALPDRARAYGEAVTTAELRVSADDFVVDETLGFEPSGDGEHDFLLIEKRSQNTAWVARQLAEAARVPLRDVGYAGLKDRRAVTRQWFSVRRPSRDGTDWQRLDVDGVTLVDVARNSRKLRRGAHRGNRFRIALRADGIDRCTDAIGERLCGIGQDGIPNYFGAQRYGREGGNVELARRLFAGDRLSRERRGFALSAARALLFDAILERRVIAGSWNRLLDGERVNLDGSGSNFLIDTPDADLAARCAAQDVHPTGTLWGSGAPRSSAVAAALEREAVSAYPDFASGLVAAGVAASSRALRARVSDVGLDTEPDAVWLRFSLPRGAFATAVVREIVSVESQSSSSST